MSGSGKASSEATTPVVCLHAVARALACIGLIGVGLIASCLDQPPPRCAVGVPAPGTRILVFSRTVGFRHASIPDGLNAITSIGERLGIAVEHTEDASAFTAENLARFSAVVFLSTTGNVLDSTQESAFQGYVQAGGGFVGVHAAADAEYDWEWYGQLLGAYFSSHPSIQEATVHVEDQTHVSTSCLPSSWRRTDEWYNFRASPGTGISILATVDESTYSGGTMGSPHPIAWYHRFDGGRAWYTAMGHTSESYAEPGFLDHLAGGIVWAASR